MGMAAEKIENTPETRSFTQADEVRSFAKGKLELIRVGGMTIGRATLEPGWKWSECVKPLAGTPSCEAAHFQYQISGVLEVLMDDGARVTCRAGSVTLLPKGHDAWVVGSEPVVLVDWQGMLDYAVPRAK